MQLINDFWCGERSESFGVTGSKLSSPQKLFLLASDELCVKYGKVSFFWAAGKRRGVSGSAFLLNGIPLWV